MAFGTTPKDAGGIPISCVYVPGVGFVALQGSIVTSTDGSSNQSAAVALQRTAGTVLNQASAAQTTSGNSADLPVGPYTEISFDANCTAGSGTSPTVQFFVDRKGADGIYYPIWQSVVQSTFGGTVYVSTAIGTGQAINQSLGTTIRVRWTIGGTSSPSVTFSISVIGK